MTKKNNLDITLMRGISVWYIVVIIHSLFYGLDLLKTKEYAILQSFFLIEMSIIFFLIGATSKISLESRLKDGLSGLQKTNNIIDICIKKFLRIYIPSIFYSIIILIIAFIFIKASHLLKLQEALVYIFNPFLYYRTPLSGGLWFVPVYIYTIPTTILLYICYSKLPYRLKILPILLLLTPFIYQHITKNEIGYNKTSTLFYSMFIYLGFFFQTKYFTHIFKFIIIFVSIGLLIYLSKTYTLDMQNNKFPPNIMFVVFSFLSITIMSYVYPLLKYIVLKIPYLNNLFTDYSKHMLSIFFYHSLALWIASIFWSRSTFTRENLFFYFIGVFLCCIIITHLTLFFAKKMYFAELLFSKYLPPAEILSKIETFFKVRRPRS